MTILTSTFWKITGLVAAQTFFSLLVFSLVIVVLVFLLRKPVRKYKPVDLAIFERIKPTVNPGMNKFMVAITFLGKHQFLIPANLALIIYFLFVPGGGWFSVRVGTIALSSLALMFLLKYLFQRKRPLSPLLTAAKGLSFPSGHAIMAVTFYGLLVYIIFHTIGTDWIKFAAALLIVMLIFLIGYSRVYLRVHYASDVLAGFIIGTVWLLVSLSVLNSLEQFSSGLPDEVSYRLNENKIAASHESEHGYC